PPAFLRSEIDGRRFVRVGVKRKLSARFCDEEGVAVSGVIPVWTVTPPSDYEDKVLWLQNEDFIEISVLDDSVIGQEIIVELKDEDGLFPESTVSLEVLSLYD